MKRTPKKQQEKKRLRTCQECQLSYDWHSEALDGHLILCRCQYYENGKWCKFLGDFECGHFVLRSDNV